MARGSGRAHGRLRPASAGRAPGVGGLLRGAVAARHRRRSVARRYLHGAGTTPVAAKRCGGMDSERGHPAVTDAVADRRLAVQADADPDDSGRRVLQVAVVVGKPSTPTPVGLFAIAEAVPGNANAFTGSWILALTAHSNVLERFDGGDGTVGIHGRGGASRSIPSDPGRATAASGSPTPRSTHWSIGSAGPNLPGTPVRVT